MQRGDDTRLVGYERLQGIDVARFGQLGQLDARFLIDAEERLLCHQLAVEHVRYDEYAAGERSLVRGAVRDVGDRAGEQRLYGVVSQTYLKQARSRRVGVTLRVRTVHFAHYAGLSYARMVDAGAGLFIDAGSVVPEFHGIGYDAGIGDARIVEECDTRILRGEEQVVGVGIHGGEHQPLPFGRMECERGRRTGSHGGERAALNVILRRDYVFELDRRLRAGGAVVVIVVTGRKGESCEKQSRSECGEKVLFFHS